LKTFHLPFCQDPSKNVFKTNKPFTAKQTLKMPLIVPGINSGGDASKTEEWANKLVGKKLGDGFSDATVRS
jgi:hypothetical protein